MNNNVAGVHVPDAMIKTMADAPKEQRKAVSAQMAAELVKAMKPMCQGLHLMPLGWDALVPVILEQAGLAPR